MSSLLPTRRTLLIALALLVTLPAAAQKAPVVAPGSDLLDLSRIQPHSTVYTITVVQGDLRQEIGTYTQTITLDEAAGVIENVSAMDMMGQQFADTTRAAWPSLAARYHASDNPQRALRFSVEDGLLSGTYTPSGEAPEAFELSVDGPIFDSAWLDDVAGALPLAAGYAVTIPAYSYEAGGLTEFALRVAGSEKLARQGKPSVDVWVIEASSPDLSEALPRFYLSKEGHDVVRIRVEPQPGVEILIDAQ